MNNELGKEMQWNCNPKTVHNDVKIKRNNDFNNNFKKIMKYKLSGKAAILDKTYASNVLHTKFWIGMVPLLMLAE